MATNDRPRFLLLLKEAPEAGKAGRALAAILGATAYEVGLRLAAARRGPAVLAASHQGETVDVWVARLEAQGLEAQRVDRSLLLGRRRIEVRDWRFAHELLEISNTQGEASEIRIGELRGAVQALAVERHVEVRVTSQRRLSLGRAIATGGLLLSKKETREQKFHHMEPLHRLALYPLGPSPILWMAEERLRYSSLPQPLAPSRGANFARVVESVRERLAPPAFYDEQLLDHRRLAALLGPAAGSGDDLALAMALVAQARSRNSS